MSKFMEKGQFKLHFTREDQPTWPCPKCGQRVLQIVGKDFLERETGSTYNARNDPHFMSEWSLFTFAGILRCANRSCNERVTITGRSSLERTYEYDELGDPYPILRHSYVPLFFHPALKMFEVPEGTPESTKVEINKSFEVFFADPPSASNHIRNSIEDLLGFLKVKKFAMKNRKRIRIPLHIRIKSLPSKHAVFAKRLEAIKWLGNAGSHPTSDLDHEDVLDSYTILEEVLVEMFADKRKAIDNLVREINSRKGPKKRRRSKSIEF